MGLPLHPALLDFEFNATSRDSRLEEFPELESQ